MPTRRLSFPLHTGPDGEPALVLDLAGQGSATVITISGELDISTTHLLTECVQHLARQRTARVVLDMAQVSFFCAAGLRALLQARDTLAAVGRTTHAARPIHNDLARPHAHRNRAPLPARHRRPHERGLSPPRRHTRPTSACHRNSSNPRVLR